MACTLSLLYKLVQHWSHINLYIVVYLNLQIQNWTHKAAMCGFNLVPVPSLSRLGLVDSPIDASHPFLHPRFVPLKLPNGVMEGI